MNEAETLKDFKEKFDTLVKSHKGRIVITSHINPDDDSISSSLATYSYLKDILRLENEVGVFYSNNPVDRWSKIKYFDKVNFVKDVAEVIEITDLLIILDCQGYYRVSNLPEMLLEKKVKTVIIDHHKTNPDREYDLMLSYPTIFKSSNAEIIYSVFYKDLIDINTEQAEILLLGIYGDTGSLRYIDKESSAALTTVESIIKKSGIKVDSFLGKLEKYSIEQVKILACFLSHVEIYELPNWGKFSVSFVTREEMTNYKKEQLSAGKAIYSFYQKAIGDSKWGVIFYPDLSNNKEWSLSFRSQPGSPNVRLICQALDPMGGGHDAAAGASLSEENLTIKLNAQSIKEKVFEYLKNNQPTLIPA